MKIKRNKWYKLKDGRMVDVVGLDTDVWPGETWVTMSHKANYAADKYSWRVAVDEVPVDGKVYACSIKGKSTLLHESEFERECNDNEIKSELL